jgi:hypothetical protein
VANESDPTDGQSRVLLGTDTKTHNPVYLPYAERVLGVAIIGKAGTGKSSLLEHAILADLEHGTPGMVIDPHGLLIQRVMECATPEQAERIILLEAVRTAPFGLNLLDVRDPIDDNDDPVSWAADSVVATIKKLYGEDDEFLPRLERYLDLSARTLIPSRLTLLDAPRLFEDMSFRQDCLSRVRDPHEQQSLRRSWAAYDKLRPGEQITHTEALVNRLERLLAPPIIRGIVGSRDTTVPFDDILHGDSMLLASLPSDRLSPERCDFIGAMLLCALVDRIFARSVSGAKPPRLHIYLDEYQRFATATTAELLEQGRKYNAGVTLAHQTLYQIPDQRIRNAARHAGTLIALSMTRPDAEELAGEFPITPQEEWIETIEEVDGVEPVYVLSPTPADDIYLEPHDDPDVDLAARSFFASDASFTGPGKYVSEYKASGHRPRPGGVAVDERVKLPLIFVRDFLTQAMAGAYSTNHLLCDALIEGRAAIPGAVFFEFANASPVLKQPQPHACETLSFSSLDYYRKYRGHQEVSRNDNCQCHNYKLHEADKAHNREVDRLFHECSRQQQERIRSWVMAYLEHRDDFRAGEDVKALREADFQLLHESQQAYWCGLWNWTNPLTKNSEGVLRPMICLPVFSYFRSETELRRRFKDAVIVQQWKEEREALDILRQRLRWLLILADGLERSPLWVASGQQQPRRTKRHIVHSAQTHADALNEVAGKLVHPPKRYVAHVRKPQKYHQVKLRPPLECGMGDGAPTPTQPDDIRTRSRVRYRTHPQEESPGQPPSVSPEQRRSPDITRHSQNDQ